ncbi:transcriptional regulator, partial [Oenococcus oeni]
RALDKATGAGDVKFEEATYEGYAPGGIAVLVETSTDNINRTVSNVRNSFNHHGGSLGTSGSVSFQFDRRGHFVIDRQSHPDITEDQVMEDAIEAGAEDVQTSDDAFEIFSQPADFAAVEGALTDKGYDLAESEITMIPQNPVEVPEADQEKFEKLIDELEDNDDVLAVYTTAD